MTGIANYRVEPDRIYETYKALSVQEERKTCVERLRDKLKIHITKLDEEELVFDFIGADPSLANALRRILLAEVPTMAIETAHVFANSSILHDEVLAHRLGLVPILADPDLFEDLPTGAEATEHNTLVFDLDVAFTIPKSEAASMQGMTAVTAPTMCVYSDQLIWKPMGDQAERLADRPPKPVHDKILLAKLKPGQRIKVEGWCRKGVGKDHAKFSPVATASYRLLPRITVSEDVRDEEADELVAKCPMNVFDIEDWGMGQKGVKVARPRDCTMCRECIREGDWSEKVKLARIADHFIFSVESVGILPPERILKEAIKVLRDKATTLLNAIDQPDG